MNTAPRGGLLFLATLVVASLLAPYLAPFAADAIDLANRRAAPSMVHWFGTDELGRDVRDWCGGGLGSRLRRRLD